jgi:hypothetical protein
MDKQEIEALKKDMEGRKQVADKKDNSEERPKRKQFQEEISDIKRYSEAKEEEKLSAKVLKLIEEKMKPLERKINGLNDGFKKSAEQYKKEVSDRIKPIKSFQKKVFYFLLFITGIILLFLALGIKTNNQIKKEIKMLDLNLFALNKKIISPEVKNITEKKKKTVKQKKKESKVKVMENKKVKKSPVVKKISKKAKKQQIKKKTKQNGKSLKIGKYVIVSKFKIKRYHDKKEGESVLAKGKIKNISKSVINNVKMNIKLLDKKKKIILERSFNVIAKGEKKVNKGKILKPGFSVPFSVRIGPDRKKWAGKCSYFLSNLVLEKK